MMGYYGGLSSSFGWFGMILMVVWWVLIIVAIVALIRWIAGKSACNECGHAKSAMNVLKERYARGEIDRQEFEEKKKDLTG